MMFACSCVRGRQIVCGRGLTGEDAALVFNVKCKDLWIPIF